MFFFSSRRRHTRLQGDWSSDVCSSDLLLAMSDGVQVSTCQGFPSADQLRGADVVVFYSNNPGWSKEKAADQIGRASCRERVQVWGGAGARQVEGVGCALW